MEPRPTYRTTECAIWTDPKVRALSPYGRYLFWYLITSPHSHVSGIYYLPILFMAHETGLPVRQLHTLLDTLSTLGLAHWDRVSEVVWVVKMFDHQGRGAKNNKAAAKQLASLHKCKLVKDFLEFYSHRQIPYTIPYAIPKPTLPNQEQEQEQDNIPPLSPLESTNEFVLKIDTDHNSRRGRPKAPPFSKPTVSEVAAYCSQRRSPIDPEAFWDYYEQSGWRLASGQAMKDWQAAIRNWERRRKSEPQGPKYETAN